MDRKAPEGDSRLPTGNRARQQWSRPVNPESSTARRLFKNEDKLRLPRKQPCASGSSQRAPGSTWRHTEPRVYPEWGPGRFLGWDLRTILT